MGEGEGCFSLSGSEPFLSALNSHIRTFSWIGPPNLFPHFPGSFLTEQPFPDPLYHATNSISHPDLHVSWDDA